MKIAKYDGSSKNFSLGETNSLILFCLFFCPGGYSVGSLLYQFCSTECPFLFISGFNVIDACLLLTMLSSNTKTHPSITSGLENAKSLLKDPLIVITLCMYLKCVKISTLSIILKSVCNGSLLLTDWQSWVQVTMYANTLLASQVLVLDLPLMH